MHMSQSQTRKGCTSGTRTHPAVLLVTSTRKWQLLLLLGSRTEYEIQCSTRPLWTCPPHPSIPIPLCMVNQVGESASPGLLVDLNYYSDFVEKD